MTAPVPLRLDSAVPSSTGWLGPAFDARRDDAPGVKLRVVRLESPAVADALRRWTEPLAGISGVSAGEVVSSVDGAAYLVRPWSPGPTIGDRFREGRPPEDPLALLRGVLEALANLHRADRAHGNLHPDNIAIEGSGALLLDPRPPEFARALSHFLPARGVGGSWAPLGATLDYVAPEQRAGRSPDPRSDLYAFGVLAYRLLAGAMPLGLFPPLSESTLPAPWVAAVSNCLACDPGLRPPGAHALVLLLAGGAAVPSEPARAPAHRPAPASAPVPAFAERPAYAIPDNAPPADPNTARSLSPFMVLLFLFGGCMVLTGLTWLAVATWDYLPEWFRTHILTVATVGLFFAAYRFDVRNYRATAVTLSVVGALLLPVDAAYLIHQMDAKGTVPWIWAMGLLVLLMLGADWYFQVGAFVVLSAAYFAIGGLLVGTEWAFEDAAQAVGYLTGFGLVAHAAFLGLRTTALKATPIYFAVLPLFLAAAYLANFTHFVDEHANMAMAIGYPLALGLLLLGLWRGHDRAIPLGSPYVPTLLLMAIASFTIGPALIPLFRKDELGYLVLSTLVGAGALGVSFVSSRAEDPTEVGSAFPTLSGLAGLFALMLSPVFLPLLHRQNTTVSVVCLCLIAAVYGCGRVRPARAGREDIGPIAEAAALIGFQTVLIGLAAEHSGSFVPPLIGGVVALAVLADAYDRQVKAPFLIAGLALLGIAGEQYVLKLRDVIPWYLAAIGVGVVLLVLGTSLEGRRRELVEKVKGWR